MLSGAGLSLAAGLKTFRGPDGLWRGLRSEDLATPAAFAQDPRRVWDWYRWRFAALQQAVPTPGHLALAGLAGRHSVRILTQNVDGLHQLAGSRAVVELHGTLRQARCTDCSSHTPMESAVRMAGVPACPFCGAALRPAVIWFGESLPEVAVQGLARGLDWLDLLLVVGTSARVWPAAGLIAGTLEQGLPVLEVNPEPGPFTGRSLWLSGDCQHWLPILAED